MILAVTLRNGTPSELPSAGADHVPAPQAAGSPPALLSELLTAEDEVAMRFKPASPDMARSRTDPRITRGGIQRRRQPLVEI
jgi:hypothetical protein